MSVPVRIIGAGHMGALHARTVFRHPQTRLVEVADLHDDRARALMAAFGEGEGVPELTIVCTPASQHPQTTPGEGACLVEKPLARDASSAASLVRDQVWVSHPERFAYPSRGYRSLEAWRCVATGTRGRDVDVIADLLVHDLDLLVRDLGGVPELEGIEDVRWGPDGIDALTVRLGWDGGSATLEASRIADVSRRLQRVDGAPRERAPLDPLSAQLEAWLSSRTGEPGQLATPRQAVEVLQLCDRIRAEAPSPSSR